VRAGGEGVRVRAYGDQIFDPQRVLAKGMIHFLPGLIHSWTVGLSPSDGYRAHPDILLRTPSHWLCVP